jgi:hypothetical protein
MRRLFILSVCAVACCAMSAKANTFNANIYNTDNNTVIGTLNVTRTQDYSSSGRDQLVVTFGSLIGDAAGDTVNSLCGTWTASAGKNLYVGDGNSGRNNWISMTTNVYSGSELVSFVNLDNTVGVIDGSGSVYHTDGLGYDMGDNVIFARSGTWNDTTYAWSSQASTYLTGLWYAAGKTLGPAQTPVRYKTLATLYTDPDTDVTYTGQMGFTIPVVGGQAMNVTFTVPEPGTNAMLACLPLGLVGYGWMKRRRR